MAQGQASTTVEKGSTADKAARVFEFLVELQRLKTRVVRDLTGYRSVLWYADLPSSASIESPLQDAELQSWLSVDRVERDRPPAPPTNVDPWLTGEQLKASERDAPMLSFRILVPLEVIDADGEVQTITDELLLTDHPDVEREFAGWLPTWKAWALEDRRRREVAEKYQQLYEIHQDARALAETYEVVLCMGLLRGTSGGAAIRRHIFTARATVELDLSSGRLSVEPDPEDASIRLEQDMLDPADSVPEEVRLNVVDALGRLDGPWGTTEDVDVMAVLRTWTNGLSADAHFDPGPGYNERRREGWYVTYAPAIILRERTRGSFIAAGQQIVASLRDGAAVPRGVQKFVEIGSGTPSEEEQAAWATAFSDGEIYFSKPANLEQRQILERLAHSSTLVVQGPPGTGKTHTIANLITDLLAHGQRVLITSTTARALKVLKDQLPPEVADLCVSVTDDAAKGQADLEKSVKRILQERQEWNAARADAEASRTRRKLHDARERAASASQELLQLREVESFRHAPDVGDYQGTLAEIAARLADEESELGWLGAVPDTPAPFSENSARDFLRLLRAATPALRARAGHLIDVVHLLPPRDFEALCRRREDQLRKGRELEAVRSTPVYASLETVDGTSRARIRHDLREIERLRQSLTRTPGAWVPQAVNDVLAGKDKTWMAQLDASRGALLTAGQHVTAVAGHSISGLQSMNLDVAFTQTTDLAQHLTTGGKLRGLFGPTREAKAAAELLDNIRVDGRRIEGNDTLAPVWHLVRVERALQPQERLFGGPLTETPLPQRLGRLEDEIEVLSDVVALARSVEDLRGTLRSRRMVDIDPRDPSEVADLQLALDAVDVDELDREVQLRVHPLREELETAVARPSAAPANRQLLDAVLSWDGEAYRAAHERRAEADEANTVLERLRVARGALAPHLSELLQAVERDPSNQAWTERFPKLVLAWEWSVWNARIARATDPSAEAHARRRLEEADGDRSAALRSLAGNRGWAHCMQRLSDSEATHLNLYSINMRKVGRGMGKYAARYRSEARKALRTSQTAVPAWIMPMHQVFETVPVEASNIFDVVIVDEASQSGLEGLLLSWLAPRIVVVGDDKQVSPSNVGLDHEQVFSLQDRYLNDLPTKSLFGPLSSLFDQAVGMAGQRLMLREHFRCMPEIIAFSNELSYDNQLIALRQYGAERLPPLRTTYVRGAMVSGSGSSAINEAEAEALVQQVVGCVADPAYEGKSLGVITLLGTAQDKLLTDRLLDALGVEEIEARRLRVSNPEGFQGDERDVIFMSMVSSLQSLSGPARIGVLSKESDQQRLNVAASRARDQLWLFHSVSPTELSSKDLRRTLLQHFLRPPAEQAVQDLGEVLPDTRHRAFDSLFEQRVYLAIRDRGYRVRPQAPAGRYRIDLVVEGDRHRLAVECDGDAFHGADEAEDDVSRQRELERVGWVFWRVRGSAFFRDPHAALASLWARLEELGIHPMQSTPGEIDHHRVVTARAVAVDDTGSDEVMPVSTAEPDHPAEHPTPSITAPAKPSSEPPSARASAAVEVPRFRGGKVLVSAAARRRVQDEIAGISAWLAAPPGVLSVDDRSRRRQAEVREDQIQRMEDRLEQLQRVVQQSEVDPSAGGQWVTPGCRLALRFGAGTVSQDCVISVLENEAFMHISPDAPLGQALEGAELGSTVTYDTPKGPATAMVAKILD